MLRSIIKKRFVIQSIALCEVLFFVSLCAMEPADPVKNKKQSKSLLQRLKRVEPVPLLVNCGITHHLIPKEVMALISRDLTLQDIGRLNRVNKAGHWDFEHICPAAVDSQKVCNTLACKRLAQCHYDIRTKVLAHYAQRRNVRMFNHLWMQDDEDTRFLDLDVYLKYKYRRISDLYPILVKDVMKEYAAHYCTAKKIEKRRLKQLIRTLCGDAEAEVLLRTILPSSGFDIFFTAREYRKKQVRKSNNAYSLSNIFKNACKMQDPDFIIMMLNGKIYPHVLKYIFAYASWGLINQLRRQNAFVTRVRDKHGKDFETYMEDLDRSEEKRYLALRDRENSY